MNKTEYLSKPKINIQDDLTWRETQKVIREQKGDVKPVFLDHTSLATDDKSVDTLKLIEELREISRRRSPEMKKHNDSLDSHLMSFSYMAFKR